MSTVGFFNVIRQERSVLLIKRNNESLWDLPGGSRHVGEHGIDCLERLTREELGVRIMDARKVGNFINYETQAKQIIFTSLIESGELPELSPSYKELKFFPIKSLPINLVVHRKHQIKLAFSNRPVVDEEIKDSRLGGIFQKIIVDL